MDISGGSTVCLGVGVPALLLSSWAVGSLMAAIGKVRGWNTKRVFWFAAISYALLLILVFMIVDLASSVPQEYPIDIAVLVLLVALVIIGLLSPLGILVLRWRYPDAFTKSTPVSNTPVALNKEPALQRQYQPDRVVPFAINTIPTGHIFVSYRRSDSADIAGRIYDRLIGKFGKDPVFKDVDSIPLGYDFKEYLDKKVGECDVLLAIIGDRWLDASDPTGKKRLETQLIL